MVTLPPQFVAVCYPGYFWNHTDSQLYSLKGSGELRPIKYFRGGIFYGIRYAPGYRISVLGKRRLLTLDYLNSLPKNADSVIPLSTEVRKTRVV